MTVQQEGQKFRQYLCALVVSIGAIFIGTSAAWTSPCLKFLLSENYTDPSFVIGVEEANVVAALVPLSAIFGSLPAGKVADLIGRKLSLILSTILQLTGSILATFAGNVIILNVARVGQGLALGMYSVLIPMYISEIAEVSIRGALGSIFEILINIGILYMYCLGMFDSYFILSNFISATAAVYLFSLLLLPESPTYFVMKNEKSKAEKSLKRLRGPHYNVENELNELQNWLQNTAKQTFSYQLLTRKANIKGLIFAGTLMAFQQFNGITAIVYFGEKIFVTADVASPTLCTAILGLTQLISTMLGGFAVDHLGRKILLLVSGIGMTICLTTLGYYFWLQEHNTDTANINWLPLVCLVLFMLTYAIGFGPIAWIMMPELVGVEIKNFAFAVALTILSSVQMLISYTFQPLTQLLGTAITFWIFTFLTILATIFVTFLPETKNKSLKEIQEELAGKKLKNNVDNVIFQK